MPSSPESDHPVQVAEAPEDRRQLEERNADLEDRWKRALADLDNYRKRTARDIERAVAETRDAVLRDWLEVLDGVDRALRDDDADDPAAAGLRALREQMEGVLKRYGVERVGEPGEPFDPERHEATSVVARDDVPDRTVVDVHRAGYARGDKLLRPAQVVVARREG
jgi:molecular chaperone GrpE